MAEAHRDAAAAAEAAESVAVQGGEDAFWAMQDLLYENQDALQHDDLIEYAAAAGADPIAVADDLASHSRSDRVRRDFHSAGRGGVHPNADLLRQWPPLRRGLDRPISAGRRAPRWHTRSHVHDTLSPGGWRLASGGWLRAR